MLGAKLGISSKQYNIVTNGLVLNFTPGFKNSYPGTGTDVFNIANTALTPTGSIDGPTFTGTSGNDSGYFSFDGTDDIINLGNQAIGGTAALSATVWVYADDTTDTTFLGKYASKNWNFGQYSAKYWFGIKSPGWDGLHDPSVSGYTSKWTNMSVNWDGSTRKIYLNGVEVASNSKSGTITYDSQDVLLGNLEGAGGFYYDGKYGMIMVYDRSLSAGEILQNYNATKDRYTN